jgi:pimeloyl-ACP methyl ester carboxylesterase
MYHPKANQTRLLGSLFALGICTLINSAVSLPVGATPALPIGTIEGKASISQTKWPKLPSVKDLKQKPVVGVEIYEYDDSPIDNRQPLLMVHGLEGENKECFRWDRVCAFLAKDEAFQAKYKILMARYNTHNLLADGVPHFRNAVKDIHATFGGKKISMIALSMGGNLIQQAMIDEPTSSRVERVIAMGTPFHGSPLFASDWMRFSMAKHYRLPVMRIDNCLPYKMYFDRHRNLLSDLPWDNVDNKIPAVGNFKFVFPYPIKGTLSPTVTANRQILKFNAPGAVDKSKFIVYGGFLETLVASPRADNLLFTTLHYPSWLIFTKVPEHCGAEHPVLRVLNEHIAHAVPGKGASSDTERGGSLYGLNDGITPLASALFLPDSALASHEFRTKSDVQSLKHVVDVKKARVFDNIDHVTFIDGYCPRGRTPAMRDELAPAAPERSIFHWILTDVMDKPEAAELASDSPKKEDSEKD